MSVAGVAHLVERHLAKVEVAGSSPVTRSIRSRCFQRLLLFCNFPRLERSNLTVRWTVNHRRLGGGDSLCLRSKQQRAPSPAPEKRTLCFLAKGSFFSEINPCGICEMPFGREILLCNVKCLRAWVDLFHFTFRVSGKYHDTRRVLFHIRRIFHFTIPLPYGIILARKVVFLCQNQNFEIFQPILRSRLLS